LLLTLVLFTPPPTPQNQRENALSSIINKFEITLSPFYPPFVKNTDVVVHYSSFPVIHFESLSIR
jgi:hypothetical protein